MIEENTLIHFLMKFDQYPFCVRISENEYNIGNGAPEFTINLKKPIPLNILMTSTSLALGEAYMDGDLEIEGNLYYALDHFLGQMDRFSTDESALKKLMFTSTAKKTNRKKFRATMTLGTIFISSGWTKP